VVALFAKTKYVEEVFNKFKLFVPGTVGSIANLDLFSEDRVCSATGECLQIKKGSLGSHRAEFILIIENSTFRSRSYVCSANN